MITACELHEKIIIETAIRKEEEERKNIETAAFFIDKVMSPFVDSLKEMPKDTFIGYAHGSSLYKSIDKWEGTTNAGYSKYGWDFSGLMCAGFDNLSIDHVNRLLEPFGFILTAKPIEVVQVHYCSNNQNWYYANVKELRLSTLCPFEN